MKTVEESYIKLNPATADLSSVYVVHIYLISILNNFLLM